MTTAMLRKLPALIMCSMVVFSDVFIGPSIRCSCSFTNNRKMKRLIFKLMNVLFFFHLKQVSSLVAFTFYKFRWQKIQRSKSLHGPDINWIIWGCKCTLQFTFILWHTISTICGNILLYLMIIFCSSYSH